MFRQSEYVVTPYTSYKNSKVQILNLNDSSYCKEGRKYLKIDVAYFGTKFFISRYITYKRFNERIIRFIQIINASKSNNLSIECMNLNECKNPLGMTTTIVITHVL